MQAFASSGAAREGHRSDPDRIPKFIVLQLEWSSDRRRASAKPLLRPQGRCRVNACRTLSWKPASHRRNPDEQGNHGKVSDGVKP